MTSLEHKLGSELFVRTKRGSLLTPAGQRFLLYARRCLEMLHDAHEGVKAGERERLVVAAPASLGAVIFLAVLEALAAAGLRAHGRVAHSAEVIELLLDGTADIGFSLSRVAPAGIVLRRLCRSELITVGPHGHPLAGRAAMDADDLLDRPVAIYRWGPDAEGLADTFELRRRDRPVHFLGLPSAALDLVRERDHVAVVPAFAAVAALAAGTVAALPLALPGWSLDVQLAYPPRLGLHPRRAGAASRGTGDPGRARALTHPQDGEHQRREPERDEGDPRPDRRSVAGWREGRAGDRQRPGRAAHARAEGPLPPFAALVDRHDGVIGALPKAGSSTRPSRRTGRSRLIRTGP